MFLKIDLNSCRYNPCLNNGICFNNGPDAYECLCSDAYTGRDCELGK